MKKSCFLLLALALTLQAIAQTLSIRVGGVSYMFPASETGDMVYRNGTLLTVLDRVFS